MASHRRRAPNQGHQLAEVARHGVENRLVIEAANLLVISEVVPLFPPGELFRVQEVVLGVGVVEEGRVDVRVGVNDRKHWHHPDPTGNDDHVGRFDIVNRGLVQAVPPVDQRFGPRFHRGQVLGEVTVAADGKDHFPILVGRTHHRERVGFFHLGDLGEGEENKVAGLGVNRLS